MRADSTLRDTDQVHDRILERAVLPLSRVPAIDRDGLARADSVYRFIQERYGLTDGYTEQTFEVDTPSGWEAEQLELARHDPIVRIRGVSFHGDGRAFDCFDSVTAQRNSHSVRRVRLGTGS